MAMENNGTQIEDRAIGTRVTFTTEGGATVAQWMKVNKSGTPGKVIATRFVNLGGRSLEGATLIRLADIQPGDTVLHFRWDAPQEVNGTLCYNGGSVLRFSGAGGQA
jgi:hypothetical protein